MVQNLAPSRLFHALGDPNRLQMLEMLTVADRVVTELGAQLNISLPATLKHLRILEGVGLASSEKVGRERICKAELSPINDVIGWANHVRSNWNARLDSLERLLEEQA